MLKKVQRFIEDNGLLQTDHCPVIVGVSGGSDSVVLLDILLKLGYHCIIAHCNFHLRMEESNRDERFVRNLASKYSLPIDTIDFETLAYASTNNVSIEMAARELRYAWFEQLINHYNAQAVAVGHHLDDTIETVLINLARGTGLKGLTGIPMRNGNVVRPLLGTSRKEIKQYIDQNHLKFVEDSSNLSTDIIRNKIRHEVIPLLEDINPSFRKSIRQTQQHLTSAYNIFQERIDQIKRDRMTISDDKVTIQIQQLHTYVDKATILYELLKEYNFHPDQTSQIAESLEAISGKMFYSSTHVLLKDRENIIIQLLEDSCKHTEGSMIDGTNTNLKFRIFKKENNFVYSEHQHIVHLDADKVSLPLVQRSWQPADYFYPLGMQQRKKLSDFLIDEKINRLDKKNIQVLTSKNQIVWVVGLRIDNRFKVTKLTQQIIEVSLL